MRCAKCNHELDNNGNCPYCQNAQNVQTMTNSEANNYSGITIEDENNFRKENSYQYRQNQSYHQGYRNSGMKVRYVRLGGNSSGNWLTKALIGIGGIAVLGFFFFVALPAILTVVGAGIVAWLIFRFFKRY